MKEEMVCYCKRVTKGTVVKAIGEGAGTLAAVRKATGACTGNRCKELNPKGRCCSADILGLIEGHRGPKARAGKRGGCCCRE